MLTAVLPERTTSSARPWNVECDFIEGLRAGDDACYERMVREYGEALHAVAFRLLRNDEDARDAVQDAFLGVVTSIGKFRGDSSLRTWLHRLVFNAALMRLRSASRRPETSLDAIGRDFDSNCQHAITGRPEAAAPHARIDREETCARVRDCIRRLPPRYRDVITLRDLEQVSTADTAVLLDVSETVVKVRLHRARRALAAALESSLGNTLRPAFALGIAL